MNGIIVMSCVLLLTACTNFPQTSHLMRDSDGKNTDIITCLNEKKGDIVKGEKTQTMRCYLPSGEYLDLEDWK